MNSQLIWAHPPVKNGGSGFSLLVLAPRRSGAVGYSLQSLALRLRLLAVCQRTVFPKNTAKIVSEAFVKNNQPLPKGFGCH